MVYMYMYSGSVLQNDPDEEDAVNHYFAEQASLPHFRFRTYPTSHLFREHNPNSFSHITTTPADVLRLRRISETDPHHTGRLLGAGITSDLLKRCAPGMAERLSEVSPEKPSQLPGNTHWCQHPCSGEVTAVPLRTISQLPSCPRL